jgi:hypothetical protein
MKADQVPAETLSRVESELLPGEELLWVERPGMPGLTSVVGSGTILTGGLPVIAVVFVMVVVLFNNFVNGSWLAVLLAVPLLLWRASLPYVSRMRSVYALTNRRALILIGSKTRSFTRNDIKMIERRGGHNGTSDVVFAKETRERASYKAHTGRVVYTVPIGFFSVKNPEYVEALMLDIFRSTGEMAFDKPKNDDLDLNTVEIGPDGEIQERRR